MAYATRAELVAYIGESVDLPSEAEQDRLLERASELIDYATLDRIDVDDDGHAEAARKAVCAQVEAWLEGGEFSDIGGAVSSYSVGSVSVNYGGSGQPGIAGTAPRIAPRARGYLFRAGLLYRGVRAR